MRTTRARAVPALLVAFGLAAAGCSSDDASGKSGSGGTDAASSSATAWSPCDGLSADTVSGLVGERVTENVGTPGQERCTFTPTATGGAAYDLSYLWFDGGLDTALRSMGAAGSQLRPIEVPGADAARLAVTTSKEGLLVTGFVQTDGLVQSVNAAQLAPYRRTRVVAGTRALLAELARQAPSEPQPG